MRRILIASAAVVASLGMALALLRTPDTDRDEMIVKYGGPSPKFAEGAGGLRVHWRDEGCRDCPAILLLHGSNASLQSFEAVAANLAGEFRVITYDQPGHGLTGPHPRDDYTAAGMFEALNAVAGAAGIDHFYLGGNSMGGWVAWRYALAHPERVDGLILIDAAGAPLRAGETPPPLNLGFRLMRNKFIRPLIAGVTPRSLVERSILDSTSVDSVVTDEMVDRYWELLRFPGNRRATAIRADVDREPEFFDRVGEIAQPTLIIWGADDQLIYASAARTFDEKMPNAEAVIFDGVGHLPMEEAPEATANAIRRFLESQMPEAVDTLGL
jgi:pimeloyl-ACP methyl ester carboxylesterase